ncbi:MAG: protein-glutamine glutaminase family protein [Pseudobdellovibrio sp.]
MRYRYDMTPMPLGVAQDIFKIYTNMDLNWADDEHGCQNRSEILAYDLETRFHTRISKVTVTTEDPTENYVSVKKNPDSRLYNWSFHVAPLVEVQGKKSVEFYVLDPVLFDKIVPFSVWRDQIVSFNKDKKLKFNVISRYKGLPFGPQKNWKWERSEISNAAFYLFRKS